MNVKQLKAALADLPDSLMVVVPGYEGGYNEVRKLDRVKLRLDYYSQWYYGDHEDVEYLDRMYPDDPNPKPRTRNAVCIEGSRKRKS